MLGQARTTEGAIAAIDGALRQWESNGRGSFALADARVSACVERARATISRRRGAVGALEARRGPEADPALEAAIAAARRALDVAVLASREIESVVADVRRARRTFERFADGQLPAAEAALRAMIDDIGRYRAVAPMGGASPARTSVASPPAASGLAGALAAHGRELVDLSDVDYSDNPVIDGGKGGATAADYRWAVETWDSVVAPGLEVGATRDDFAGMEARRGGTGFRSVAGVFDLFVGESDCIVLSRRAGGGYDVINGRHRIDAARASGIGRLPARIV